MRSSAAGLALLFVAWFTTSAVVSTVAQARQAQFASEELELRGFTR